MAKIGTAAIKDAVCREFGLKPESMVTARKLRFLARPRQIAMYLSREIDRRSFADIGTAFGRRDHSTAIHAHRTIAALVAADPDLRHRVDRVRASLATAVAT